MNRFQLYNKVKPFLFKLDLNDVYTLCSSSLYNGFGNCSSCPFSNRLAKKGCILHLRDQIAQKLKADIIIKHPELLI